MGEVNYLGTGDPYTRQQNLYSTLEELGPGGDATEQLRAILRQLGLESIPPRLATIQEGLLQRNRLAAGSPQEILTTFNQQINQIQQQLGQQLQAIGRQGGYALGGQRQRAQGQAVGQALGQYQGLIGQGVLQGQQELLSLSTGVTPTTATGVPAPSRSVTQTPANVGAAGEGLAGLANLLRGLFPPQGPQGAIGLSPQSTIQQPPLLSPSPVLTSTPLPFAPAVYGTAPGTSAFGA